MNAGRIVYRTRQFWNALCAKPVEFDLEGIHQVLNPTLMALFACLEPGEQAHSIHVYHLLAQRGENHPDLQTAALLHDVGKSLYPLRLWERVAIVLAKALAPEIVKAWGSLPPGEEAMRSWRRPFVIAEQHPGWGADMAAQAGASPLAVSLIRRHQEILRFARDGAATLTGHPELPNGVRPGEGSLSQDVLKEYFLSILQSIDNES